MRELMNEIMEKVPDYPYGVVIPLHPLIRPEDVARLGLFGLFFRIPYEVGKSNIWLFETEDAQNRFAHFYQVQTGRAVLEITPRYPHIPSLQRWKQ